MPEKGSSNSWFFWDAFIDWEKKRNGDTDGCITVAGLPLKGDVAKAINLIGEIKKDFERDLGAKANEALTARGVQNALILHSIVGNAPPVALGKGSRVWNKGLVRDLRRYVQHAGAVYGYKGNGPLSKEEGYPKWGSEDEKDMFTITHMTGIAADDVLVMENIHVEHVEYRGYYIAVERSTGSVVLAIRGTMLLSDVLADLVASTRPFLDGKSHGGVAHSAERLYGKIKEKLVGVTNANPGYRLVLCGHSLGAGIAILITAMLERERQALGLRCQLRCFAVAPPAVFAPLDAFPPAAAAATVALVNHADCVPRISMGSAFRLLSTLKKVDELELTDAQRLAAAFESSLTDAAASLPTIMGNGIRKWLKEHLPDPALLRPLAEDDSKAEQEVYRQEFVKSHPKSGAQAARAAGRAARGGGEDVGGDSGEAAQEPTQREYDYVFIPGRVLFLGRNKVQPPKKGDDGAPPPPEEHYSLEEAAPHNFTKIMFSSKAVDDHLVDNYDRGLKEVLEELGKFPYSCNPF